MKLLRLLKPKAIVLVGAGLVIGCTTDSSPPCPSVPDNNTYVAIAGLESATSYVDRADSNYELVQPNVSIPIDRFAIRVRTSIMEVERTGEPSGLTLQSSQRVAATRCSPAPPGTILISESDVDRIDIASSNDLTTSYPAGSSLANTTQIYVPFVNFTSQGIIDSPDSLFVFDVDSLPLLTEYEQENFRKPLEFLLIPEIAVENPSLHDFQITIYLANGDTFVVNTGAVNLVP